jgi:hypothetical protein
VTPDTRPPGDLARFREAFAADYAPEPPASPCRSPAWIWEAARGQAPPRDVEAFIDHTTTCSACGDVWRLARSLVRESDERAVAPGGARPAEWLTSFRALATAAALLLAVGFLAYRATQPAAPAAPARFRESPAATAVRSLVDERTPLPRARVVLRWTPGPPGSRYDLEVLTEDLRLLTRASAIEVTEYAVPEDSLAALASGSMIVWRVETIAGDGRRTPSPPFLARIE